MNEGRSKRRRASSKPLRYQHDESEDEKTPPNKSPPSAASAVKKNTKRQVKTTPNKGVPTSAASKQPSTNNAKDVGEEETPSKKPRIKIRLSVKGGKGGAATGSSSPTPNRGKRKTVPEPQDDNNGKKKSGGGKRKIEQDDKGAAKSSSKEIKVRVKVNNKACREGVAIAVKDEPIKKKKAAPKKKGKEEEKSDTKSSTKEIKVRVKVDNKTCKEGVAIAVKEEPVKKKKKAAASTNKKVNSSSERQKFIRKWNRLSTQTELMKACEEINVACGRATVEQLRKRLMKWLDGTYPEQQEEIKVRVKVNNKTCSEGVTVAIKGGGKKKKVAGKKKKGNLKKEEESDNSDVDEIDEDDMDVEQEKEGGDEGDEEMEEVDLPQDNIFEGGAPDISAAKLKFPYRLCKVPTCNKYKKSRSDGYCRIHYQEFGPKSGAKKKANEDEQSEEEEVEDSKPAAKKTKVPQDVPQDEDSAEQPQDPKTTSAENTTEGLSVAKASEESTDNSKEAAATPSVRPSNYVQITAAFKCSDVVDAVLKSKKSFKKLRNGSRDYIKELAGKEDIKFGNQYWQSIRSLLRDAIDAAENGEEINHASLLRLYTTSNNMAPLSAEDRLTLRSPRSPKKDAPKAQASSLEEEYDIDDGVTKVRVRLSSKLQQGFCQAILPAELREKWEMVAERPKKKSEETTNKKVSAGESTKNEGPKKPENGGGAKLSYYMKQAYGQVGEVDGDDDEYETETIVKELYQCPKCDKTNLTKNGMHAHWGMKHSNYDSKSAKKSGDNGVKCDLSLCKVVGKTTVVVRKKKNNNGNKKVKKRKSTDGALPSLGLPKIGDDAAMEGEESTPHITVSPSRPAWPPQNLKASRIDPSQLDFEVNLNPIKKTNGSLKCLAVGCEKNQQGSAKFCRTHHNQYLICMGLCGSWECKCGSKIADFQDRCGKCHRWRDGKHPGNGNADPNKSRKVRNSLEVISKRGMEVADLPTVQETTAAVVPLPQAQLDTIAAMSAPQQKQVTPAASSFGGIPSEISVSQGAAAEVVAPPPPELPINRNYKVTVNTDNGVEQVPISYPPDNLNYYGSIHPALGYPYISLHYDFNLSYYQNNTYDYLVSGLGRGASSAADSKEDDSSDDAKEGASKSGASSADEDEEKKLDDEEKEEDSELDKDASGSEVESKQSV